MSFNNNNTTTMQWPSPNRILRAIILHVVILVSALLLLGRCHAFPAVLRGGGVGGGEEGAKLKVDEAEEGGGGGRGANGGPNPDLFPQDHMDAVKMERNGALNKEFQQELFWGPEHEEMTSVQEEMGRQKLMDIFKKVDTNNDKQLTMLELSTWIEQKTAEHYSEALASSRQGFPQVDTNKDGKLTWEEYRDQFFRHRGLDEEKLKAYREGKATIDETLEQDYAMYRDRWDRADEDNSKYLSIDEFLAFLHPEHCKSMLSMLVEEVLHDLNQNEDTSLSLREFLSLPDDRQIDMEAAAKDDEWVRERKQEFEANIDTDGDGIATFEELERYMDPRNKQHAESEARHLIGVADQDGDGRLSAREVNSSYFVFLGSKVYNYARNVHDEF